MTDLEKIKSAGVVGAGGAGFPTHVKLAASPDTVIANCIECEPLIHADKILMETNADKIIRGLRIAGKITGAKRLVIGVKYKNKAAVAALKDALGNADDVELALIDNFYPAGDEQQLIYEVTGRRVAPGALPISAGCVVSNASSLANIADAIEDKPVTDRILTVTGDVSRPFTAFVPIGTPVSYLLELAGGCNHTDDKVILGGPLMGRVSDPEKEFVTKTTNGVIAIPCDHPLLETKAGDLDRQLKIAKSACCQCSQCTMVCSRNNLGLGVKPHMIMRSITQGNAETLLNGQDAMACCDCGLCTYIGCNMGLTPGRFVMMVKRGLMSKGIKPDASRMFDVNPMRDTIKAPVGRIVSRIGLSEYDKEAPLVEVSSPRAVRILLRQHIGASAVPAVKAGDTVNKGDLIASPPENALGANIHASISGKVSDVTDQYIDIYAG